MLCLGVQSSGWGSSSGGARAMERRWRLCGNSTRSSVLTVRSLRPLAHRPTKGSARATFGHNHSNHLRASTLSTELNLGALQSHPQLNCIYQRVFVIAIQFIGFRRFCEREEVIIAPLAIVAIFSSIYLEKIQENGM